MNKSNLCLSALAVSLGLFAGGCAMTPQQAGNSAVLAGKYQINETVVILDADGTYVGTNSKSEDWVKGTYKINGDQLTIVDTWELPEMQVQTKTSCIGPPGKYRWTLVGEVLTFNVIDDPCGARKERTDGVALTRVR